VNANLSKVQADLQRRSGILYPPVQASYFPDKGLRQRVEQLLLQFYELYDGKPSDKSRQMLVNAYDENVSIFVRLIVYLLCFRPHSRTPFTRCTTETTVHSDVEMSKSETFSYS
jgi:hypothetical protein